MTIQTLKPSPLYESESVTSDILGVSSDKEALALFLKKVSRRSSETLRRYTRELVRFTAFINKELNKKYRQLTIADIEIYIQFIQAPPVAWQQVGIDTSNPKRIFFPNAIKPGKSTDQIIMVLSSFFSFLHTAGYTQGNPTVAISKTGEKIARGHKEPKFFFEDEWQCILDSLYTMPTYSLKEQAEKERTHFIMTITYGCALRQSELVDHTCNDIKPDYQSDLMLHIRGKGRRLRILPVTADMMKAIKRYRNFHNMSTEFAHDNFSLSPKLYPVKTNQSKNNNVNSEYFFHNMRSRSIRLWFDGFIAMCARNAEKTNHNLAKRLRGKSFHSIRHTALSHLATQMSIEDLSIFAGHESITTTQQYYTPEKNRLKQLTATHSLDFYTP